MSPLVPLILLPFAGSYHECWLLDLKLFYILPPISPMSWWFKQIVRQIWKSKQSVKYTSYFIKLIYIQSSYSFEDVPSYGNKFPKKSTLQWPGENHLCICISANVVIPFLRAFSLLIIQMEALCCIWSHWRAVKWRWCTGTEEKYAETLQVAFSVPQNPKSAGISNVYRTKFALQCSPHSSMPLLLLKHCSSR